MEGALDVTNVFRQLRLWRNTEPVTAPSSKPLPPLPMVTYDNKGFPSLPDDIIHEIFGQLDTESLKSCSLTGKVVSSKAKPFLHRTLCLTPRLQVRRGFLREEPNTPGDWNEFKGLPLLGDRGLLQHTRHLSIFLSRNPLFPHDLRQHVRYLHAFVNIRSLKTRWLDIPSFLSRMGEYFGAFLGSLQSLDLEYPRGDHKQVLYFICQFKNLKNLRIKGAQDPTHSMRNGGPHFDIDASPPLDGILDLEMYTEHDKGAMLIVNHLSTIPLRFRTLKILGCTSQHSKRVVDACGLNLEHLDLTWYWLGQVQVPPFSFTSHNKLRKLVLRLIEHARTELVAAWLSETLPTITSNEFTELTIYITSISFSFYSMSDSQVRAWNAVDDVLDRLSLCEDVALTVRVERCVVDDQLRSLIEKKFPLMWENGRVTLEGYPPCLRC